VALVLSIVKLALTIKRDRGTINKLSPIILSIIAINVGIIAIGRYNQTSVVFQFPLFYILIVYIIEDIKLSYKNMLTVGAAGAIFISSIINITPYLDRDYNNYLDEISKVVKKDNKVLANLNCEFYFENGKLNDYRNLAFLKENNMRFEEYIKKNNIEYIIYPEEMEIIYKEQPRWDGLYGKLIYYEDMKGFFEENCELVYEFYDPTYGMRISRYIDDKQWTVKIYKVKDTL
jgi:hypothetical protein